MSSNASDDTGAGAEVSRPQNIALKQIDEDLTCNICLGEYQNPKTLPCLHTFCLDCIKRLPKREKTNGFTLDCPVCRRSHDMATNGIDTLPHAHHIANLFELQQVLLNAPSPATPMSPPHQEMCPKHNDFMRVFCNTCNSLICRDCTVSEQHRTHDWHLISDLLPLVQNSLVKGTEGVQNKLQLIRPVVTMISEREQSIKNQGEEVKIKLSQYTKVIIDKIQSLELELREDVDSIVNSKCRLLRHQQDDIFDALAQLERRNRHVQQLSYSKNAAKVMTNYKNSLELLKDANERVDKLVLTPVEEANIEFIATENIHADIGHVKGTFLSSDCHVKLSHSAPETPIIAGMVKQLKLLITKQGNSLVQTIPSCLLDIKVESVEGDQPLQSSLVSSEQSEYTISFHPEVSGVHYIRVYVCDIEVQGSPISITVSYSPSLKNRRCEVVSLLNRPHGCVSIDDDTLAVVEYNAHRITFINKDGERIRSFGSKGQMSGQFNYPRGIALSADRNTLLVTDNHRIQQLSLQGVVLASAGEHKYGPSRNEFYNPTGIAVDFSNGHIYVADTDNNRIQVLNDALHVMTSFGRSSNVTERLKGPYDVALDNAGDVYVADSWNHCIKKFSSRGRYLCQISCEGVAPGNLNWPTALAFNSYEYLYVTEQDNKRVSIFSKEGVHVDSFTMDEFNGPQDVFVDCNGDVYVSDTYKNKLYIFHA